MAYYTHHISFKYPYAFLNCLENEGGRSLIGVCTFYFTRTYFGFVLNVLNATIKLAGELHAFRTNCIPEHDRYFRGNVVDVCILLIHRFDATVVCAPRRVVDGK